MPKSARFVKSGALSDEQTMGKKIIDHQGVAFMLADMAVNADAARNLVWRAAWTKDAGKRNCKSF